jgi:REP element-mobilizing transposase RayT
MKNQDMAEPAMSTPRIPQHIRRMGRSLRPNLPGVPFHLTARLQHREPLFCGVEAEVTALIQRAAESAGVALLAWAIMPNHVHIVAVQGTRPLSALMQPFMRSVALLLNRRFARQGHVFERRYRHAACLDPDYLRNTIAYVHLNAVRARICRTARGHAWSSHRGYCASDGGSWRNVTTVCEGRRLFARTEQRSPIEQRLDYLAFLRWRLRMDRHLRDPERVDHPGYSPVAEGGDAYWRRRFPDAPEPPPLRHPSRDIRLFAIETLTEADPPMSLDQLRSGRRGRELVRIRRLVIARCVLAGHRTKQIAAFLGITPSAVSIVAAPLRRSSSPTRC